VLVTGLRSHAAAWAWIDSHDPDQLPWGAAGSSDGGGGRKRLSIRRLMAAGRPRAASTLLGSSGTSTRAIIAEAGLSKKKHLKSKLQFDRLSWLGDVGALV
jgi:hypothetical protein